MTDRNQGTEKKALESDERTYLVDPKSDVSYSGSLTIPAPPETSGNGFFSLSREKKFTIITMCLANFCQGAFYSLLAPFFPNEAKLKGASSTETGLIFGVFELIIVLTSPIFGALIGKIGGKFMYVSGLCFCGSCAILFGFLDECPPGVTYVVMCFVVRTFEALGAAAFTTASYAIMAVTFPDSVAQYFGTLEMFNGLGLMVGPPLGGALYQAGGFKLPFMLTGGIIIIVGLLSTQLLPKLREEVKKKYGGSVFQLIKIPVIPVLGIIIILGSGAIGFLDATLSLRLQEQFNLNPTILGLIFLVGPGVYAFAAPFWGWVADKKPVTVKPMLIIGYIVGGLSFVFMGPAPFIPIPQMLWLIIVCQGFMGGGLSTGVVTFQEMIESARFYGFPDNLETYGLVSGVFGSLYSFGAFLGPVAGGYLNDVLKFPWASTVVGLLCIGSGLLLLVYIPIERFCCPRKEPKLPDLEEEELISPPAKSKYRRASVVGKYLY